MREIICSPLQQVKHIVSSPHFQKMMYLLIYNAHSCIMYILFLMGEKQKQKVIFYDNAYHVVGNPGAWKKILLKS